MTSNVLEELWAFACQSAMTWFAEEGGIDQAVALIVPRSEDAHWCRW